MGATPIIRLLIDHLLCHFWGAVQFSLGAINEFINIPTFSWCASNLLKVWGADQSHHSHSKPTGS